MRTSTVRNTLLFLSTLLPDITSALGINCRGSGMCTIASWENKARERITQVLRDAIYNSPKPANTTYGNGDHIICVSQFQQITLTNGGEQGVEADGVTKTLTSSIGLSGAIGGGGICLFPHYMAEGATLSLADIRPLTDAILEHGCGTCGSVPIHYHE